MQKQIDLYNLFYKIKYEYSGFDDVLLLGGSRRFLYLAPIYPTLTVHRKLLSSLLPILI